jgi:hypothetical protein
MAQEAYSTNTIRALRADWEIFSAYCHRYRAPVLPAAAKTVRDFVFECAGFRKKPATIRRYVATIGLAHRAAGVADPVVAETVKLALKEMGRTVPARQSQARGLVWSEIAQFLEFEVRIGLPKAEWERISGHSCRVGAAQDMLALNIDMASVMQAGRWKDTRIPMRYGEKILASRGAMARAARSQGRA